MMEWQPIETAPKDGTEILVYMDGDVYQSRFNGRYWRFPVADYHGCGCCSGTADEPTHWMPLPKGPNE